MVLWWSDCGWCVHRHARHDGDDPRRRRRRQGRDIYPPEESRINTLMDPVFTIATKKWQLLPTGIWILLAGVLVASFILRYTRWAGTFFADRGFK